VTVTLFFESWFCWAKTSLCSIWLWMNAGWDGGGSLTISLLSIETTVAIVGLSFAISCTQRSPICMHLKIWSRQSGLHISRSIKDIMFSSIHIFHALKKTRKRRVKTIKYMHSKFKYIIIAIKKIDHYYYESILGKINDLEKLTYPKRLSACSWL